MSVRKTREPDRPPIEEDVWSVEEVRGGFRKGFLVACVALGCMGAMATTAIVVLVTMIETGRVPDSGAMVGDALREETLSMLRESGLLGVDEEVLYYYSDAMFSFRDNGNFFTAQRVVSYRTESGELMIEDATYAEIADITATFNEGYFENSYILVERTEGNSFYLAVSNESGLDRVFVRLLMDTWLENR